MKIPSVTFAILAAFIGTAATQQSDQLPVFNINLDLAPKDRFKEVTTHFKPQIQGLLQKYQPLFPSYITSVFKYLDFGIRRIHHERAQEIDGIAEVIGANTHTVLMVNYVYEFSSFCTSLIAKQPDGLIIHERMLDFSFPDDMRTVTYVANFYKGGELQYEAVMFGGLVAMQTGFKKGAFSISINQRQPSSDQNWMDFAINAGSILIGGQQTAWLIRDTLAQCSNFDCAFHKLATDQIIAPAYFVVAGTKGNEGAIISRDRMGPANITQLSDDHWYLVQTNSDHFAGECPTRCVAARSNFDKLGHENVTPDNIYTHVLDVYPNLNQVSIHTSVMIPSQSVFNSRLVWGHSSLAMPDDL